MKEEPQTGVWVDVSLTCALWRVQPRGQCFHSSYSRAAALFANHSAFYTIFKAAQNHDFTLLNLLGWLTGGSRMAINMKDNVLALFAGCSVHT